MIEVRTPNNRGRLRRNEVTLAAHFIESRRKGRPFFHHGLPNASEGVNLMFPGMGPIDMSLNGGDGFIYIGMTTGSLVRIDPQTAEVEYLGKPTPEMRITTLQVGPDCRLYGTSGHKGKTYFFAYDRQKRVFDVPGTYRSLTFAAWLRIEGIERRFNSLLLTDGFEAGEVHGQITGLGQLGFSVCCRSNSTNGRVTVGHDYVSPPLFTPRDLG